MISVARYEPFLRSLAGISRCDFEIWEGRDVILASSPFRPISAERRAFAAAIMNGDKSRHPNAGAQNGLAGVPLRCEDAVVGALIAWPGDGRQGSPSGTVTLSSLLTYLAELIHEGWASRNERERITEDLGQSYEDLYLYARISGWVKTMYFSPAMLDDLVNQVLETMHCDLAFVSLDGSRRGGRILKVNHSCGRVPETPVFVDRLIGAIPRRAPSLEEQYFIVNDSSLVPGFGALHAERFRALVVMIRNGGSFYGWFGVVSFNMKDIFSRSQLRLIVSIAEQVGVIISNTELYWELKEFVINMVKSLVYAIEAKDVYTRGHSERVNQYSLLMAERLHLDEEQKNNLHWASILHDVGKIGIPEQILNYAGPLSRDEYDLIKAHPAKGYAILKPLDPLHGSLPGILHHHERYDGSGYPDGLKGEEIPLLARIIAVPDTFDALNSNRAYRVGKPDHEALTIVESLAGTQLDPFMVRVLAEIIGDMEAVGEKERIQG